MEAEERIAGWVREELARRGWSIAQLAERSGWPNRNALTRLLKLQQRLSIDDLKRIARGFDVPLATMLSLALGDGLDDSQRRAVSDAAMISLGDYGVDGARIIAALLRQVEDYQRQLETLQPSDAGKRSGS